MLILPNISTLIAWLALTASLLASLALGANRPVTWVLVSGLLLFLLIAQTISRRGATTPPIGLPALLYLGVLAWSLFQATPDLAPMAWHHPVWEAMPTLSGVSEVGPAISADPIATLHGVLRLSGYGALFVLIVFAARDEDRALAMLRVVALFSAGLAVYGLYCRFVGVNPLLGEEAGRGGALSASFVNRNHYATFAAFGVIANLAAVMVAVAAGQAGAGRRQNLRSLLEGFAGGGWIYVLGFMLCLGAVVLTMSRGGGAALLVGLTTFALLYRRRRDWGSLVLMVLLVGILALVALTISEGLMARLLTTSEEGLRFVVYPEVLDQALERPWLGHGLGAFHEVFRAHVPLEAARAGEWNFAHNTWLENLHDLGAPAALALWLSVGIIVAKCFQQARAWAYRRTLPAAAVSVAAIAGTHSLVDFSMQIPACVYLFVILLGLGWAQSLPRQS